MFSKCSDIEIIQDLLLIRFVGRLFNFITSRPLINITYDSWKNFLLKSSNFIIIFCIFHYDIIFFYFFLKSCILFITVINIFYLFIYLFIFLFLITLACYFSYIFLKFKFISFLSVLFSFLVFFIFNYFLFAPDRCL